MKRAQAFIALLLLGLSQPLSASKYDCGCGSCNNYQGSYYYPKDQVCVPQCYCPACYRHSVNTGLVLGVGALAAIVILIAQNSSEHNTIHTGNNGNQGQ